MHTYAYICVECKAKTLIVSFMISKLFVHTSQHEDASVKMLDHLLEVNNLKKPFLNEYGITDDHLNFVKHLIQPKKVPVSEYFIIMISLSCNTSLHYY